MDAIVEFSGRDCIVRFGQRASTAGGEYGLTELTGWTGGGVGVRRKDTERSGGHGDFSEAGKRTARLVSVGVGGWGDNRGLMAAALDDLNAFLADGERGRLVVIDPDLGTRQAACYLHDEPRPVWDTDDELSYAITLKCPDPRKYGEPGEVSTAPPEDGGGLAWDLFTDSGGAGNAGVLDFGAAGSDGTVVFTNPGTADTAARLRVDGYAPGFTITDADTGRRLVYTGTILAGQYIELDPNDGTVKLNGDVNADRSTFLTVREWTRTQGKASTRFFFETAGKNARLTVEGTPAWW